MATMKERLDALEASATDSKTLYQFMYTQKHRVDDRLNELDQRISTLERKLERKRCVRRRLWGRVKLITRIGLSIMAGVSLGITAYQDLTCPGSAAGAIATMAGTVALLATYALTSVLGTVLTEVAGHLKEAWNRDC